MKEDKLLELLYDYKWKNVSLQLTVDHILCASDGYQCDNMISYDDICIGDTIDDCVVRIKSYSMMYVQKLNSVTQIIRQSLTDENFKLSRKRTLRPSSELSHVRVGEMFAMSLTHVNELYKLISTDSNLITNMTSYEYEYLNTETNSLCVRYTVSKSDTKVIIVNI